MGRRIGVVLGVSRLVEDSHIIVQGQEDILRHHRVQQTRSGTVQRIYLISVLCIYQ